MDASEKALIENFQARNPAVTVERLQAAGISSFPYIRGETLTDVVGESADFWMFKSVEHNELVDLSDLWQRTGLDKSIPATLQAFTAVDGKQYYVPYGLGWFAIYYNKEVFERYGLTPPATWDEFLVLCETLKQKGETPIVIPGGDWAATTWFDYLDLRINGAEFHRQLQGGQIPYTDERVRSVLEAWQTLLIGEYVHPRSPTLGMSESLGAMVRNDKGMLEKQKAAMMLVGSSQMAQLPANFQVELDFFAFPTIDPSVPRAEVMDVFSYILPRNAERPEDALAYAESVVSLEAQQAMMQADANIIPVHPGVDLAALKPEIQQGKALLDQAAAATTLYLLNTPETISGRIVSATANFLLRPEQLDEHIKRLEAARQVAVEKGDFVK
ncbi:MAG TPA: extracellular solute-binding protein [Anaerolineae bacterium]|nr:extracellular solute-binding protein [Anaerolineae bacterium]